jgi:hypothetical protein
MRPLAAAAFALVMSACPDAPPPAPAGPVWSPGVMYPSEPTTFRGHLDLRGLVHAHSFFSHDACDDAPVINEETGERDPVCFEDFRRGLCQSKHDFVFLTDHRDSFDSTEFPDALLFRPERGDVLISHADRDVPSANDSACEDGHRALIMAGSEAGMMPVGIEGHPVARELRGDLYGARTPEAAATLHDAGAVILLAHPEDFTVEELIELPVDGFEMYNLHRNTLVSAGVALDFILRVGDGEIVPHPDLLIASLWSEDPDYLERWGRVMARGKRIVTTMGTDCHRNTFQTILEDGERADSYRRMMIAFSNHLRVLPNADGSVDDRALKAALAAGRNWGAFEMLGHPVGYDAFVTEANGDVIEMGGTASTGATLTVRRPTLKDLDPAREPPAITVRVLRAVDEREGFVEVARAADGDVTVALDEAGVYRAEVRMVPHHLREDFRSDANFVLREDGPDFVWLYGGTFTIQ